MMLVSLHGYLTPLVNASETMTLDPIASVNVSNTGEVERQPGELKVYYFQPGVKEISYLAFNLSEIPPGAVIDSVVFKVKSEVFTSAAWISAYCTYDTEWVKTGMSWESRPNLEKYVGAARVSLLNEWYFLNSSFFKEAISEALTETSQLTIGLEYGLFHQDVYEGIVIFYPNAELEITYTPDTSAPTLNSISVEPGSPTPDDEVTVSVTATDDRSGVKEMYLYYSTDGVNWVKVLMSLIGDSKYEATIPQQSEDTTVQYYIEAFDNALNKAKSETSSYIVKSPAEISPLYVLIGTFVVFGISIIIGILILRSALETKGRGSVKSIVNCYARSK